MPCLHSRLQDWLRCVLGCDRARSLSHGGARALFLRVAPRLAAVLPAGAGVCVQRTEQPELSQRSSADLSAWPWEDISEESTVFPLTLRVFHFFIPPIPVQGKGQTCAEEETPHPFQEAFSQRDGL